MTKRNAVGLLGLLVAGTTLLTGCPTSGPADCGSIPTCAPCNFTHSALGSSGTAAGTMTCMPKNYDAAKVVLNKGLITEKTFVVGPVPTISVPFSYGVSPVVTRPSTAHLKLCWTILFFHPCHEVNLPVP